jgi:outer membrane protein OmpA-like peptidoglycan-associated protein
MIAARHLLAACSSGILFFAVSTGNASDSVKDPNAIIRALAPIEHLPEHQGRKPRPAIDLNIRFALNKATLAPDAKAQLDALGQALLSAKLKGNLIEIAGHTDATGPAAYNKALSLRRAEAVLAYLKSQFEIKPARLSVAGHGEDRLKNPLAPNSSVNRRVEISVLGTLPRDKITAKPQSEPKQIPIEGIRVYGAHGKENKTIKW